MNIQAVARRTGVPAATLRKWEQRYGVLAPVRTKGSHRRYSEADVLRVEWLQARLAEGYRIGEAARLLGTEDGATPPSSPGELAHDLVEAARATDPARIERLVGQALALYEPERAIGDVLEPALEAVGECWERDELTVGQEHVTSEIVRGRLRALLDGRGSGPRGRAVLACVAGERHEIGLLALGVLLQGDGWGILYLGADTPLPEAAAIAVTHDASLLCMSATGEEAARSAAAELDELSAGTGFRVLRGGAAFGGEPAAQAVAALRPAARGSG